MSSFLATYSWMMLLCCLSKQVTATIAANSDTTKELVHVMQHRRRQRGARSSQMTGTSNRGIVLDSHQALRCIVREQRVSRTPLSTLKADMLFHSRTYKKAFRSLCMESSKKNLQCEAIVQSNEHRRGVLRSCSYDHGKSQLRYGTLIQVKQSLEQSSDEKKSARWSLCFMIRIGRREALMIVRGGLAVETGSSRTPC